jgi:hypothetical protein
MYDWNLSQKIKKITKNETEGLHAMTIKYYCFSEMVKNDPEAPTGPIFSFFVWAWIESKYYQILPVNLREDLHAEIMVSPHHQPTPNQNFILSFFLGYGYTPTHVSILEIRRNTFSNTISSL